MSAAATAASSPSSKATTTASTTTKKSTPPPPSVHHGYSFIEFWKATRPDTPDIPPPKVLARADDVEARPGYNSMSATELEDQPEVMKAKIEFLLQMQDGATFPLWYGGAGMSTASINDYASKASGSVIKAPDNMNRLLIPPTVVHRTLAAWNKATGEKVHFISQNHDNLELKAGWPKEKIVQIHGAWQSSWNRVLMMDDKLHPANLERMMEWWQQGDFVLTLGTSLSGMTSDSVVEVIERKHKVDKIGVGVAIISLQQTSMDARAALRVFGRLEAILGEVKRRLKLRLDSTVHDVPRIPEPRRGSSRSPTKK